MNEPIIVPEARGKAQALSAWEAQGGSLDSRGRFTKGKLRGMNKAQALERFEGLWEKSSDGIKDKYARRAGDGALAPSERNAPPRQQPSPTHTPDGQYIPNQMRMPMSEFGSAVPPRIEKKSPSPAPQAPPRPWGPGRQHTMAIPGLSPNAVGPPDPKVVGPPTTAPERIKLNPPALPRVATVK
jgi:hypothetical protein